ncbi:hypothetical protein niasHT_028390 [Heterodera trifolii]|uniref:BTB domain-containing protein n=1 Tax=Heterodera trifolii TaxID=157864 RepID=A0ABD2JII8_9BILA
MSKAAIAGLKLMLSTGGYADVHFLVGDGDAKELVPAHKLILKHASDVFEAMFCFDAKKEQSEDASANCPVVEVPDVEASAFKVMLSFIYMEDLSELNGDNAMAVLYAGGFILNKKYARLFDLEDYVNNCLAYIDKNADTLLKSDAFLQIDQKMLCEILEPENRRQMLGSALFQIRFPFLSNEDFLEKIVPFGILTTNEVIGVEQFHTNQNLQFPSHQRIKAFGTLLMDIEKVSEFAGEEVGSMRHIENVYINGLSWKMGAQIRMKWRSTDNENCLGIYLLCTAPKEDSNWRCRVHSATFRIVSQKKGAHNSTGTLCDNIEKDKVTLAIDITVKKENINKIILDQSKSKGKLIMEIEKMSEFAREIIGSERKSENVYIKGFPWKILAQIQKKTESNDEKKWLCFYLLCDTSEEDSNWRCCVLSATFRIVSQKNRAENSIGTLIDRVFDNKLNMKGFYCFISFSELMEPKNGFYDKSKDKVTMAIDITTDEPKLNKCIISDPSKSNGTISMELEKVSGFAREVFLSERKSETVTYIKGLSWKILAQINPSKKGSVKCLGIFLSCAAPKEENWSCECSGVIRIFSQKNNVTDLRREFDAHVDWGFSEFLTFADLMDPEKGFYNESEDKVTLPIDFTVEEAKR